MILITVPEQANMPRQRRATAALDFSLICQERNGQKWFLFFCPSEFQIFQIACFYPSKALPFTHSTKTVVKISVPIWSVCGIGWPWFAWAAQEFSVQRMGACCGITKLKSTHINPAPAFHAEPKADIGLSVQLIKAVHKVAHIKKSLKFCYGNF